VRGRAALILLLAALAGPVAAQDAPPPGAEYRISVLTAGVGAEVWELWGHNMIRVRNDLTGADLVYNWGMFSFAQKGFVTRFLMGRMNYWMASDGTARTLRLYEHFDRTIIEQQLDLTPEQRVQLVSFLEWNAEEANRYYHYDYYVDNCSTRLRDAIDRTLGGALRRATEGVDAGSTYRNETRRLSAQDELLYTGLMIGLGPFTDRPMSRWDEMFLPGKVMERLRAEYEGRGQGALFEALRGAIAGSAEAVSYSEVGQRVSMTEGAVKMAAHRLRGRYREILRDEIGQTVAGPEMIDEEIRFLMDSL
jgi:hypothetical protein